MTSSVGIALLTYNGEKYLGQVLDMVQRQKLQLAEILAIDSGSTDRTLDILKQHRVRLHQIPNAEFSHSRTRNCAAKMLLTDFLVFLTQDATPADSCWLQELLQPFAADPSIAGVYSRQVPRPGSDLLEARDVHAYFGSRNRIQKMPENQETFVKRIMDFIQFSNASAAYRRELLVEHPFDERLSMAEDQEWAKRMLERGGTIAYQASSVVLHSHDFTLPQKRARHYEFGVAFSRFLSQQLGHRNFPLIACSYNLLVDFLYIAGARASLKDKLKWLSLSPWHRAVTHYAYYLGWNSELKK